MEDGLKAGRVCRKDVVKPACAEKMKYPHREWSAKPKLRIAKVDVARKGVWIRKVFIALRHGHEVPGFRQWRKSDLCSVVDRLE